MTCLPVYQSVIINLEQKRHPRMNGKFPTSHIHRRGTPQKGQNLWKIILADPHHGPQPKSLADGDQVSLLEQRNRNFNSDIVGWRLLLLKTSFYQLDTDSRLQQVDAPPEQDTRGSLWRALRFLSSYKLHQHNTSVCVCVPNQQI